MKTIKTKTKGKATAINYRLIALLEQLPSSKVEELLDFADFLVSRLKTPRKVQRLGDRFAGVWKDERTAEEIIADIRNSRIDNAAREEL